MTVLLDTSVLFPALRPAHPEHARCRAWLDRAKAGGVDAVVSTHTLAELYATLTRVKLPKPMPPADAVSAIRTDVLPHVTPVPLDPADYEDTLNDLAVRGIRGAAVFDGLICTAARKSGVDQLVTLNPRDFRRLWPGPPAAVVAP